MFYPKSINFPLGSEGYHRLQKLKFSTCAACVFGDTGEATVSGCENRIFSYARGELVCLPWWLRGCSSLYAVHPKVLEFVTEDLVDQVCVGLRIWDEGECLEEGRGDPRISSRT